MSTSTRSHCDTKAFLFIFTLKPFNKQILLLNYSTEFSLSKKRFFKKSPNQSWIARSRLPDQASLRSPDRDLPTRRLGVRKWGVCTLFMMDHPPWSVRGWAESWLYADEQFKGPGPLRARIRKFETKSFGIQSDGINDEALGGKGVNIQSLEFLCFNTERCQTNLLGCDCTLNYSRYSFSYNPFSTEFSFSNRKIGKLKNVAILQSQ